MNTTKTTGIIVGVVLAVFFFSLGNILVFGFFTEPLNKNALVLFQTLYFAIVLLLLGVLYLANKALFTSWLEHALILFSIMLLSVGLATAAGAVKMRYDAERTFSTESITQLQAQNDYYNQYAKVLTARAQTIQTDNALLEEKLAELSLKLQNRTPTVVETIVTLPPETTTVEENTSTPAPITREYEDEVEEDD